MIKNAVALRMKKSSGLVVGLTDKDCQLNYQRLFGEKVDKPISRPPVGRKTRRAAGADFKLGEIAPVLSRGVWGGSSHHVSEITTRGLALFCVDGSRTERLKSGAVSRLAVVRPWRAEIFALPAPSALCGVVTYNLNVQPLNRSERRCFGYWCWQRRTA